MKILLSGSDGFLGKTILQDISGRGSVITIGKRVNNDVYFDLAASSPELIVKDQIEGVIHVAGMAHSIPQTQDEKEAFWKVNFEGTKSLCRGLTRTGNLPASFVFISTVSVYGLEEGNNIEESHPLNGASDYAKSKIATEQWLASWSKTFGIKLLVLRLPLVAGPYPPGNLGAMIHGIRTGRYFRIGRGEAKKSVVLAKDVAKLITKSIGEEGIYNLTDGYHPSVYELERVIVGQLGQKFPFSIPLSLAKLAAKVGDIAGNQFPLDSSRLSKIINSLTFSDEKARRELGWNPQKVIDGFRIF